MAEGGFDDENPDLDWHLDHDDEDDDDDEQGVNRTWPFQPGSAFTPCHAGEKIEIHMLPEEQCGLPKTSLTFNFK